jgi:stage II sporulation protein D
MTSRHKICFLSFFLLILLPAIAKSDPAYNPIIRVKLTRFFAGSSQVTIRSTSPFTVIDQHGTTVVSAVGGDSYVFSDDSGAKVAVASASENSDSEESQTGTALESTSFSIQAGSDTVSVSSSRPGATVHHYRGTVTVFPGLVVVDTLPLEDYLKGVLKPEIGANAPVEALKAQAVAARTYTVRNLGKLSISGADMDDTTQTQSYLGWEGETSAIDDAVDDTAGQVLLYDGSLINAEYSTDCGGVTGVGDQSEPYLAPVQDAECATEPPWKLELSPDQVSSLLAAIGENSESNKPGIKITKTDASGRVSALSVSDGSTQKGITGVTFRKLIGYDQLKSTLFKIQEEKGGSFEIIGQGWGHGLGMCQRGAIYMAQHSSLYTDILKHYYTGAQMAELDSSMIDLSTSSHVARFTPPALSTQTAP